MFGFATSYTHSVERALAGGAVLGLLVAVVLANATIDYKRPNPRCGYRSASTIAIPTDVVIPTNLARDRADRFYRAKQFKDAALTIAQAVPDAPVSDEMRDLRTLQQQYQRLAFAWSFGVDKADVRQPVTTEFDNLREAWKLDTVLGGAHGAELQARLVVVAPKAAVAFATEEAWDSAELALSTAEMLGADTKTIKLPTR